MKAIQLVEKGRAEVQEVPPPKVREGYVLVKTRAVAINPTDWKHIHLIGHAGVRCGCDYVGTVEEVGPGVTKEFKKGDRIAGFVHGASMTQPESGVYAEYLIAKGDVQIKVPDNLSDEEAATLGVSISTVGQGLYKSLGLPLPSTTVPAGAPSDSAPYILIYGGSTATGIFGIQFARLSGYRVLTTASPHNAEYLRELGAEEVYDYHRPAAEVGAAIRERTGNRLRVAWDCTGDGIELCARALSDDPNLAGDGQGAPRYSAIIRGDEEVFRKANPVAEKPRFTLGYEIFGERFTFIFGHANGPREVEFPAKPDEFEFAAEFWELSRELLARGLVRTVRPIVNRGGAGLDGVLVGLEELRNGKVSAGKLVYTL